MAAPDVIIAGVERQENQIWPLAFNIYTIISLVKSLQTCRWDGYFTDFHNIFLPFPTIPTKRITDVDDATM